MNHHPLVDQDSPLKISISVVLLILGVFVGFSVAAIFSVFGTFFKFMDVDALYPGWFIKAGLLFGTLSFVIPAWIYLKRTQRPIIPVFRFHRVSWTTIVASVLFAFGMIILTDAIDRQIAPVINRFLDNTIGALIPELQSERILKEMMAQFIFSDTLSAALLIFAAVIAAAYCEEMLIRGMFQGALENRLRPLWAILISSAVFSLIHFNPWGGIQIFIIALALGMIAFHTNSIVPTIIIHGLNNLTVILMINTGLDKMSWYGTETAVNWSVVMVGIFLAGAGVFLFIFTRKNRNHLTADRIQ